MKKILLTCVVLAVVLVWWMFLGDKEDFVANNTPAPMVSPVPTPLSTMVSTPASASQVHLVTFTDSGYMPNTITVKKGETVTWKNESGNQMWTASAAHPTHVGYSGTDIANCGTPAGLNQFDSCKGVAPGKSWSFKFDNIGTWGYHNHLNPSHFGTVVVK